VKGVFLMVMWFFIVFVLVILGIALFIDLKNRKNNNNPHITIHPSVKPGESSNYMMGDSPKDTGGGL
jgi:uncharacterized BrkB/YihY/UPF0761 family membrane protein